MRSYSYYNTETGEYSLCFILKEYGGEVFKVIDLHTGEILFISIEQFC